MKKLLFTIAALITIYFLMGCKGVKYSVHVQPDLPVEITKDVPVEISGEVTIPPSENSGSAVVHGERDTTLLWNWGEASTTVELNKDSVKVVTIVKERKVYVTLRDTVTITLRDTVPPDCPEVPQVTIPPAPPPGSPMSSYVFWGLGILSALLLLFFVKKKK